MKTIMLFAGSLALGGAMVKTGAGAVLADATPIGMPANTMVYNIAGYSFIDYVKSGVPLIIVSSIVALVLLPILFPFHP